MNRILGPLILLLLAVSTAQGLNNSPGLGYDPVGLAVAELAAEGTPPPGGYTIGAAKPGEIGNFPGKTDSDDKTILIDVGAIAETLEGHGEAVPEALVSAIKMILNHEYQHSEAYGVPSTGGLGGFNRSYCQHIAVFDTDFDYYCEEICSTADPDARATLCSHYASLVTTYNGHIDLRRRKNCPGGPFHRKGNCECCE